MRLPEVASHMSPVSLGFPRSHVSCEPRLPSLPLGRKHAERAAGGGGGQAAGGQRDRRVNLEVAVSEQMHRSPSNALPVRVHRRACARGVQADKSRVLRRLFEPACTERAWVGSIAKFCQFRSKCSKAVSHENARVGRVRAQSSEGRWATDPRRPGQI